MVRRFLAIAVAAAVFAGCAKVGTQGAGEGGVTRHAWTQPGVLRIGIQLSPNSLNPLLASNTTEAFVTRLFSDLLLSADLKGNPVPRLASEVPTLENGGISKDGLTLTYKLRKDVKWQDGVPFTGKDVCYTYAQIVNDKNNVVTRYGYDLVKDCQTPDDYSVVFHLKKRFSPIVNTLFAESDNPYQIVPEHILSKYPDINNVPFNQTPIGTGPFKVTDWVRGDHIDLEPNPDYFMGKPKLTKIVIRIVPDESTGITLMKTHELDWWFEGTPNTYKSFKTMADVKTILVANNGYDSLLFNTKRPMLTDPRVRQAIAYALDKKTFTHNLTFDSDPVATEDLPDFMWAYSSNVTKYAYNLPKAKALMAAAGWTPGPDGILQKNGEKMSLQLSYVTSSATSRVLSVQVQGALQKLGVDVQIKSYLGSLLFAPAQMGGILQTGKFDLNLSGWVAGVDPDDSTQFLCANIPPNGYNYTRLCDPKMEAAQNAALTSFDEPTRKKAYEQIQQVLADQMPQDFFWWRRQVQAVNPDFQEFDPNPVNEAWNAYQWSI